MLKQQFNHSRRSDSFNSITLGLLSPEKILTKFETIWKNWKNEKKIKFLKKLKMNLKIRKKIKKLKLNFF